MTKEEKKEEKRRKKEMKKSKESLDQIGGGDVTPKTKKKEKKSSSPGRDSQCSTGSKKKGLFKRIGSFMLPAPALAPASPPAQEGVITSHSCQNLAGSPLQSRGGGFAANSASSPNLFNMPPSSPPPPNPMEQLGGDVISVEYSLPVKQLDFDMTPRSLNPFSSDEEDEASPRRSSLKTTPSPRKDKRISFAGDDETEFRVVTPEILKRDLAATLGVPTPPDNHKREVIDLPELSNMDGLSAEERFTIYEEKISEFRDQALKIVSENSRLKKLVSEKSAEDMATVQRQAQLVLQENRTLIKEQQMNEARWQELIEERNQEVMRMRATCSNMEDQNTTLLKRCEKLEGRNEELREAYNSIVTQADDFVPVSAHLSSVEGYKVALEELRKRYDDNIHEREEEVETLEKTVSQLSERVEVLEEEKSLLVGQVKGLKSALERAQHSSTRHKREAVQLTQRVNTLKVSLAQAINIAEQSTLHKLELAEILQISDLQEKQKRSTTKLSTETKVKEVKKIANAKLKSCAEILQEREEEHERCIIRLNDRITKLKMRCQNKDEIIQNLTHSDQTRSNSPAST